MSATYDPTSASGRFRFFIVPVALAAAVVLAFFQVALPGNLGSWLHLSVLVSLAISFVGLFVRSIRNALRGQT